MPIWELNYALPLIRGLQTSIKPLGYHVALGGGVLNKGESDKDLDLYFIPLNNKDIKCIGSAKLISYLEQFWGPAEIIGAEYKYNSIENYERAIQFRRVGGDAIEPIIQRIDCFIFPNKVQNKEKLNGDSLG